MYDYHQGSSQKNLTSHLTSMMFDAEMFFSFSGSQTVTVRKVIVVYVADLYCSKTCAVGF